MTSQNSAGIDRAFVRNPLAAAIRVGLIFLLAAWCLKIIMPVFGIVRMFIHAVILALGYPLLLFWLNPGQCSFQSRS